MTVIALAGYAGVGKDTVAEHLVGYCGYRRVAFADNVREALARLDPYLGGRLRLSKALEEYSWDFLKRSDLYGPEIRRLLQVMGTEVGRDLVGPSVWIDALLKTMVPGKRYVVTDVRFPNEIMALKKFDPNTWAVKVTRPGFGPVNQHISDAGLADFYFDVILQNDGTVDDLRADAESLHIRTGT